jgi:uncharacterized glyoxalase superfamily protein PhnB
LIRFLIDFLVTAFDGGTSECTMRPDGTVGHAEVRIGDSVGMISEATAQSQPVPALRPRS